MRTSWLAGIFIDHLLRGIVEVFDMSPPDVIDHQVGTMGWAKSMLFAELKRNVLMLAKTAKILKLPTVLTSSMEEYAQGPLLSELETVLPAEFAGRI
jgi:hypothetical protein